MEREITTIRKLVASNEPINGFYGHNSSFSDMGYIESTTDLAVTFQGFSLVFRQTQYLIGTNDTLIVIPTVTGIDGVTIEKCTQFATETMNALLERIQPSNPVSKRPIKFSNPEDQ